MFYVDTSVLAAYYCPEPLSEQAEAFLSQIDQPAISALTEIELFSAISRKLRMGEMSSTDAKRITAKFVSHREGEYYRVLPVNHHHYNLAREWIGQYLLPLKTLDALHLAVASCEELTFAAFDRQLIRNAVELHIKCLFPG
jgi:uncharacterized protein